MSSLFCFLRRQKHETTWQVYQITRYTDYEDLKILPRSLKLCAHASVTAYCRKYAFTQKLTVSTFFCYYHVPKPFGTFSTPRRPCLNLIPRLWIADSVSLHRAVCIGTEAGIHLQCPRGLHMDHLHPNMLHESRMGTVRLDPAVLDFGAITTLEKDAKMV